MNGHKEVADMLIAKGADAKAADNVRCPLPWHRASRLALRSPCAGRMRKQAGQGMRGDGGAYGMVWRAH